MRKISLTALARHLTLMARPDLPGWRESSSGRAAKTIYGGKEHQLRQTVIMLRAGKSLSEHQNPGEATIYVISGRIIMRSADNSWHGWDGDYLIVPNAAHTVEADEDSVILLTVVKIH